jgi:hypothetical protein
MSVQGIAWGMGGEKVEGRHSICRINVPRNLLPEECGISVENERYRYAKISWRTVNIVQCEQARISNISTSD